MLFTDNESQENDEQIDFNIDDEINQLLKDEAEHRYSKINYDKIVVSPNNVLQAWLIMKSKIGLQVQQRV